MERHISEHSIERNENFERGRTTTMRMGMKDVTYSRNYRANERKFQHGPIQRGKFLVIVDKSSWANIKVVKIVNKAQFDHSSESSRRIVHRTGNLCGQQASQEVNH